MNLPQLLGVKMNCQQMFKISRKKT